MSRQTVILITVLDSLLNYEAGFSLEGYENWYFGSSKAWWGYVKFLKLGHGTGSKPSCRGQNACSYLFSFLPFFFGFATRGSKKWEPERNKGKVRLLSVSTSWSLRADQPVSPFLGCWSGCRLSAVYCALAGDDVVKIKWCHRHFSQMHSQIFLCHNAEGYHWWF